MSLFEISRALNDINSSCSIPSFVIIQCLVSSHSIESTRDSIETNNNENYLILLVKRGGGGLGFYCIQAFLMQEIDRSRVIPPTAGKIHP